MSAPARLTAFALALAALFAGAVLLGGAVDPEVDVAEGEHDEASASAEAGAHGADAGHEADSPGDSSAEIPPGLAVASGGYRVVAERADLPAATAATYRFRIVATDGDPVTSFDTEHEREMHLIVVRRDFEGFQHVHPRMAADGTWTARLDTSRPGTYRVFADFSTGGEALTLGTDLQVPGSFAPAPLTAPAPTAAAADAYEVRIDAGHPEAGEEARTEFTVARDGRPVDRVEPYLGAAGHLVALRDGDLAFLHTHPTGGPRDAGPIGFDVSYPSPGSYVLFLQFRHAGEVRTARFTVDVEATHG
jgi:hypothetical protein